jgi:tetratricopeptide (TPR) repeat protein
MPEEDFKKFMNDLCSEMSWKDILRTYGKNLITFIPLLNQYLAATMSSFDHEKQLRGIKKLVDAQDELKTLLKEYFDEFFEYVRKYERATYPFKIFTISQMEEIQVELKCNPEFIKQYLHLTEIENLPLGKNVLLKGKIGIGKTRTIFRLMERMDIKTIIVVTEYVKTLGVERFENLDFQDKAILVWDDVHRTSEQFLMALPFLKRRGNLVLIAGIRSTDYEKIEKDFNIREGNCFTEIDLELYQKERMEKFILLCEKEFEKPLPENVREALIKKALNGDATPLYVASIFQKEKCITEEVIERLPENVVDLWAGYYKFLSSNEKCFMKALKAAQIGFSPPFKQLIEKLYSDAFFGEPRDLPDIVSSLIEKNWIVRKPEYYMCLDVQLECFKLEDIDIQNFMKCLLEKELPLEYHCQLLLGVGSSYYGAKNYDQVIILMNRALESRPDYAEALYNRGAAYSEKGDYDRAIRDYERCGISFIKKGIIFNAILHFIQIFELRDKTECQKPLCIECGLLAIYLLEKSTGIINPSEILKNFNYQNPQSLLQDINVNRNHLTSPYSKALLHKLTMNLTDKNIKIELSEFLSEDEINFLHKINEENIDDSSKKMKTEREQLILIALFDTLHPR